MWAFVKLLLHLSPCAKYQDVNELEVLCEIFTKCVLPKGFTLNTSRHLAYNDFLKGTWKLNYYVRILNLSTVYTYVCIYTSRKSISAPS